MTLPTASTLKSMSPLASANASTVLPASSPRSSLLYRRSSASLSTLFASTSTPPTSRPVSPKRGPSPARAVSDGPFSPNVSNGPTYLAPYRGGSNDARNLILRSFVPHIAVHVSPDTDEIARQKGFRGGFRELLRPFGEIIHGKVTVRDSVGLSRSWEDFGVRFVGLGDGSGDPAAALNQLSSSDRESTNGSKADSQSTYTSNTPALRTGGDLGLVENLVEQHLSYAEMISDEMPERDEVESPASTGSPFYHLFLRKMISGLPLSPHETYAHPVACIIAISSGNEAPIEALRQLYDSSSRGEKRLPAWINAEYLRYYVLVHDEEGDDIAKSTALFEAMKRHFGLHCHLLRIRSSRCVPTDDDSVQVPTCECISAAEELAEIQKQGDTPKLSDCLTLIPIRSIGRSRGLHSLSCGIRHVCHSDICPRDGNSIRRAVHGTMCHDVERPSGLAKTRHQRTFHESIQEMDRLWFIAKHLQHRTCRVDCVQQQL